MTDPNEFLLGGGGKSFSWKDKPIGTVIEGTITKLPELKQQTKLETGAPEVWDNGDPKMQLVVSLQTTLREADDDDGVRAIYVKGSKKPESKSMHAAVAGAVQASGAKGLEAGGTLAIRLSGTHPSTTRGFADANEFEARYVPASTSFLADAAPTTPAPPQQPAPTTQSWPTTPPAAPAAPAVAAPPPGVAPEVWATLNAEQQAAMRNLVGA